MKKAFILLMSLVALVAANLSAKAQEVTTTEASKGGDVVRPINIFNTDGNWNDGSNWNTGSVPAPGSYVEIRANAVIPGGYVAVADGINLDGGSITVADGGQLKHNTENLVVTMKKNIEPYSVVNGTDNYYLLSFPFSKNVAVPDTMTAVEGCDFYAFNGDFPNAEWRNNKDQTIDSVGGTKGYLYASPEAIDLSLTGSTCTSYYDEIKTVTIPYIEGSTNLSNGWALLGNPFTCDAYIYYYDNDNQLVPMDFMVYDADGTLVTLSNRPIAPMQGFFVKVTEPTTVYILNYLFVPVASSYHEYVDFGLPSGTLWATCNVGAYWPEEYGDRFAWGETQPKDTYSWSNYQHCSNGGDHNLTKYCTNPIYGYQGFADYLITLLPEDDAVTMNWGEEWRMPTKAEMQELFDNTTHTWTTQNEVEGVLITDSNENSIFLPADNYDAFYWSSSLLVRQPSFACEFTFDDGAAMFYEDEGNRAIGWPVRAVHCKNSFINVSTNSTVGGSVSGGGTFYDGTDCTISATANDGYTFIGWSEEGEMVSVQATYSFKVSGNRNLVACFYNYVSGACQYVDMGLPSGRQWATCNVGAEAPEGYGNYYAWGETQPKSTYNWSTYLYCNGSSNTLTKYCNTDNLTTLLAEDDAATANWGAEWRMPTQEEWQELYTNTTYTNATLNGVRGKLVTASNGNSIFLPTAGYLGGSYYEDPNGQGRYWSSSLSDFPSGARAFRFYWSYYDMYSEGRYCGQSVRAVHAPAQNTPYAINATANPVEGGEVRGVGIYQNGNICTLAAVANYGYIFVNWTENGEVVSTDDIYSFTVTGERNLVANFTTNDHGYVDLGLPSGTLWANCNIGATTPEGYGDYFAWGETQPKDTYTWNTYQYCNGSYSMLTKYCNNFYYGYNGFTDNLTTLLPEDDAATANWGIDWRMPTKEEWEELYNNTTVTWTTQNGVNGRLFTASNGNSLFLPAAGYRDDPSLYSAGSYGYYWSSSLGTDCPNDAWILYFDSGDCSMYGYGRSIGHSVRPVRSESQNNTPTGAINGKFTISAEGDQVYFSQGNLQYIGSASTPYWKFADNQWDILGSAQNGSSPSKDRDLFCWGTSGYDHGAICYQPWSTSTRNSDYYAYGSSSYNLCDQTRKADWGYNAISNGGNLENSGWRTLTRAEWAYVFDTRNTTSGIRFAKANVNNVNGVIILPDDWNTDYYSLNSTNTGGANYSSNTITAEQWTTLEQYGAVFLPAAFYSDGGYVYTTDSIGYYWSASRGAFRVSFSYMSLSTGGTGACSTGRSVRLVRDAENSPTR